MVVVVVVAVWRKVGEHVILILGTIAPPVPVVSAVVYIVPLCVCVCDLELIITFAK